MPRSSGYHLEFNNDAADGPIRVRVVNAQGAFIFQTIIPDAEWDSLVTSMESEDTTVQITENLNYAGSLAQNDPVDV